MCSIRILGTLLFNIFLCDLFIIIDTTYFASYADNNALYVIKKKSNNRSPTETVSKTLFMWFTENEMMANADKCHLLLSSIQDHAIEIDGLTVKKFNCEKLLGAQFDDQLKFYFYIEKLCKNANRKLHVLARVTPYMNHGPLTGILMNAFFESQFNYSPLIWMCHSKKNYHIINRLQEKGLRIFIMIKRVRMKNYYLKIALFLCIIRICQNLL